MRIPRKIKVGAYTFKIVYKDELEEVIDKQMVGCCDPNKQQIFIKHGQIKSQEISTFLHEWIEAANHIYGIGLKHIQIEALEAAMYQLLTENKL
jgi:hypothetical protein